VKKAFSILEVLITITLIGVMVILSVNYFNTSTISKTNIKSQLQSHFQIITASILQCKELSGIMPLQTSGLPASTTLLNTLECNTTTPYSLNGGRGSFIPSALSSFSEYTATQNANEFYFSTSTAMNSLNSEVLQDLNTTYSSKQYELSDNGTTITIKFYLSR
jgi:type II secretory pathway pseudopilin PulG